MAVRTPITLSADGMTHEPLSQFDTLPLGSVPVNPAPDNMLTNPDEGLYVKLHTQASGSTTPTGNGTNAVPLAVDVNIDPDAANLTTVTADGVMTAAYLEDTSTIYYEGTGTEADKFKFGVILDTAPGNLLTYNPNGVRAGISTDSVGNTVILSGAGSASDTLEANVRVSSVSLNKIKSYSHGINVDPQGFNPAEVIANGTPGTQTVTPICNPDYDGEVIYLTGNNTTFTLDLSTATLGARRNYTIRIVGIYSGAFNTSFLKFVTPSTDIADPEGRRVAAANYIYPFGRVATGFVLDVCFYALGGERWRMHERTPSIEDTQVFRNTLSLGTAAGTLTLNNSALPFYIRSSYWTIKPSLYAMPTTTHTRTLTITLGSTQLYNATVSFVAGVPFMMPACYFTVDPTAGTPASLAALPNLTAVFGTGTGAITVKGMLVCRRTVTADTALDTL